MKPQSKQALRRWMIRLLIHLVDYMEGQCFLAQTSLRNRLALETIDLAQSNHGLQAKPEDAPEPAGVVSALPRRREKRRRSVTAQEFDLRFAR